MIDHVELKEGGRHHHIHRNPGLGVETVRSIMLLGFDAAFVDTNGTAVKSRLPIDLDGMLPP